VTTPDLRGDRRMHIRKLALATIVVSAACIAIAYATAFGPPAVSRAGPWLMAMALPVLMVSIMTLGAVRPGARLGKLAVPFLVVLVLVLGGFLLALSMPPDVAGDSLWLGLPKRAAVIVYGVGIVPLFILPLAYALTFDATTLTQADIDRVRATRLPGALPGALPDAHGRRDVAPGGGDA
jgi:hypothetical protein